MIRVAAEQAELDFEAYAEVVGFAFRSYRSLNVVVPVAASHSVALVIAEPTAHVAVVSVYVSPKVNSSNLV
jgi:hypothetical protein